LADLRSRIITILEHNGLIFDGMSEDSTLVFDSIQFITVIVELEEEFDIEIPDEYLLSEEISCIDSIVNIVNNIMSNNDKVESGKLVYIKPH